MSRRCIMLWAALFAANANADPVARLTAYVGGQPAGTLDAIAAGAADTFAADARLRYRPLAELLPEAKEDAAAQLKKADAELEAGDQAFSGMDLDPAKAHLGAAIETYRAFLPELVARDGTAEKLESAWLLLSKVAFFDGNQEECKKSLRHALTIDPHLAFSPQRFPPQMKKLVVAARDAYDADGNGWLRVDTSPPGATILVDGVPSGKPSPQRLALSSGPHDVRVELAGHKRAGEAVEIHGTTTTSLSLTLPEAPTRAGARFEPLYAKVAAGRYDELAAAAKDLGVDLIALVQVSPKGGGVLVRGWLYDARRDRVLRRADKSLGNSDEELRFGGRFFARALTSEVRLDGSAEEERRPSAWRRFRDSRWFWPVVGVSSGLALGAIAVGVGVGVAHERDVAAQTAVLIGTR